MTLNYQGDSDDEILFLDRFVSYTFDAAETTDPVVSPGATEGTYPIASYHWDFDGPPDATGQIVSASFGTFGDHNVVLTVTDTQGNTATASVIVRILES